MFSVIICSINPQFLSNVTNNISATIGMEFELLYVNNRNTGKGICKVYNELARGARYPYLIFVHEDVIFLKQNWGVELHQIFQNHPQTGAVGIAGSNFKSKAHSGWYTGYPENDAYRIFHNTNGKKYLLENYRKEKANLYDAICLDGVFIATPKNTWEQIQFNEWILEGFHFYDLDYSIRTYLSNKEVWIWMNLEMEHLTIGGDFGTAWVKEAFVFHNFFKDKLPLPSRGHSTEKELRIANTWLDYLKIYNIHWALKLKWLLKQRLLMHPGTYYNILKFLIYTPLGVKHIHDKIKYWQIHK